jgi:ABC-type cobalamin/Fe3+-siderophores transport system ATPase subunit
MITFDNIIFQYMVYAYLIQWAINRRKSAEFRANQLFDSFTLLGPGESGKSTIFKQMKVLQAQQHGDKVWTNEELINYKFIIFSNVITQMKQIIQAAEQLNIPIEADHAVIFLIQISINTGVKLAIR